MKVEDSAMARRAGCGARQTGRLDLAYLRRWAKEQGTLDLLDRVLTAT